MINIGEIREFLPHRYPFLLVDRVVQYEKGKSILALKNVTVNEEFFNGHFPQQPVMPGFLILEALAQASAILYSLITESKPDTKTNWFYLAGVNKARFKRVVIPGDQVHLHAEIIKHRQGIWLFGTKATVDNELACAADLMIAKGALV